MLSSDWILALAALPVLVQAAALAFDEFVFHHRRGLPRWECLGHPLDTFSVLVPTCVAAFAHLDQRSFIVFVGTALFSCFFVTKDEWVHARLCDAREQWLHAVLFICHPLVFVSLGILWMWRDAPQIFGLNAQYIPITMMALYFQAVLLAVFLVYQVIYWNIVRRPAFGSGEISMPRVTKSVSVDPQSFA